MSKFYIEVLDFKYPKDELAEYHKNIKKWIPNHHYSAKGINTFNLNWLDYYPDISHPIFEKISSSINLELLPGYFKFVTLLGKGSLPYHIDPNRECVFMLPLTENNAGLKWIDDEENVVCELIYKGPTVINAKIPHGVPLSERTRSFLQINLPCSWDFLINNVENIFPN